MKSSQVGGRGGGEGSSLSQTGQKNYLSRGGEGGGANCPCYASETCYSILITAV